MSLPVPADLDAQAARDLTDQIRARVHDLLPLVRQAWEGRAWAALGYPTWDDYCRAELAGARLPVERREAVAELRSAGMSTRAIGSALGASETTVRREIQAGASNDAPAPVVGTDGKRYTARPVVRAEVVAPATEPPAPLVAVPDPEPEPDHIPAEDLARLDASLTEAMSGMDSTFRYEFAKARAKATQLLTFDIDRLTGVYAENWDRELGDLVRSLTDWCERVTQARSAWQQQGLRVIQGGGR